jgi:hypothetical protein
MDEIQETTRSVRSVLLSRCAMFGTSFRLATNVSADAVFKDRA